MGPASATSPLNSGQPETPVANCFWSVRLSNTSRFKPRKNTSKEADKKLHCFTTCWTLSQTVIQSPRITKLATKTAKFYGSRFLCVVRARTIALRSVAEINFSWNLIQPYLRTCFCGAPLGSIGRFGRFCCHLLESQNIVEIQTSKNTSIV